MKTAKSKPSQLELIAQELVEMVAVAHNQDRMMFLRLVGDVFRKLPLPIQRDLRAAIGVKLAEPVWDERNTDWE